MRLIDADALKKAVEELVVGGAESLKDYYENGSKSEENSWIGGVYDAYDLIDDAPTVATKQGEWIKDYTFPTTFSPFSYQCSKCYLHFDFKSNFCMNCGADMRGSNNEQL